MKMTFGGGGCCAAEFGTNAAARKRSAKYGSVVRIWINVSWGIATTSAQGAEYTTPPQGSVGSYGDAAAGVSLFVAVFFEEFLVAFAEFGDFGSDDGHAIGVAGVIGEVVLMVVFGGVEDLHFFECGDDGIVEVAGFVEFGDGFGGDLFLFGVVVEDGGAVLGTDIGALAIECGGVVSVEEDIEDLFVSDFGGVVFDLDDFGVAGESCADLFVGRIFLEAAGVTADDFFDAFELQKDGFGAPEATAAEGSDFGFWGF